MKLSELAQEIEAMVSIYGDMEVAELFPFATKVINGVSAGRCYRCGQDIGVVWLSFQHGDNCED